MSGGLFKRETSYRGKTFDVVFFHFCWYFHAVVADKVVNHFQLVEEGLFVETFASEIKPNRIKDFLVLDPSEVGLFGFFVVFF